jgi:hypothetical protein
LIAAISFYGRQPASRDVPKTKHPCFSIMLALLIEQYQDALSQARSYKLLSNILLGTDLDVPQSIGNISFVSSSIFNTALSADEVRLYMGGLEEIVQLVDPAGKLAVAWGEIKGR